MKVSDFLHLFRAGALSLRTVLAIYFIPISVLPAIFISIYATRVFEESTRETLIRRASSERDAVVSEIDALESDLVAQSREHRKSERLLSALRSGKSEDIESWATGLRRGLQARVFSLDGRVIAASRSREGRSQIPYISKEGLKNVRARGETVDRFFADDARSFATVIRHLVKAGNKNIAILEEEYRFGPEELADLKNRREVDLVFLSRDFLSAAATLAVPPRILKSISQVAFRPNFPNNKEPLFVWLGDSRFAAFLYDLPATFAKQKHWGYVSVFVSMTGIDATMRKLKLALIYLTVLLILTATLLIFVFSRQLVKPIERLVLAMKRTKSGLVEQIPAIDSTYEIEYLVRSFNEMTRNVTASKRAIEMKLEELNAANVAIRNAQTQLVQSAKMVSLGQIVAGVAHELNNPIAFIYSNMHHLFEYIETLKRMVGEYRSAYSKLPDEERGRLMELEKKLEIDYVLKDMEDLTRSCVDGANRTKEIVLGLRTFSRMDESEFRPVDLHEGLRSTMRLLASEFKDRITVEEELGDLPLVECNLSQMNQVFMNLLSNAAHAIDGRGKIVIRTRRQEALARIEIEDSGIGMDPETLSKVFDPFFTTKKVGQGTGLGLSIAYGLVQKHGGTIEVQSESGKGTRFVILIPIAQTPRKSS